MHIRSWIWAALFAALTAVGGMIKIPVPYVPFTLQIAAVYLAACLLGPKIGALSQLLYVLVGLAGVPVFAEGEGSVTSGSPLSAICLDLSLGRTQADG